MTVKQFIATLVMVAAIPTSLMAHSGRTDSNGGHHDYNNVSGLGPYHYHHGMGPHLHPNGVCPYGSSSQQSSSSQTTHKTTKKVKQDPDKIVAADIKTRTMIYNGQSVSVNVAEKSGTTLVEIKSLIDVLGINAEYFGAPDKRIRCTRNSQVITLYSDSKNVFVNGATKQIDAKTQVYDGRTYVPLRVLVEGLGFSLTLGTNNGFIIQ